MDEQITDQIMELIASSGPQSFAAIFTDCFINCVGVDQSPNGAGMVHNHLLYLVGISNLYQGCIDGRIVYSDSAYDF